METAIEGFTVADAILVVGQKRQNFNTVNVWGKIVILMLGNLKKVDILQFL